MTFEYIPLTEQDEREMLGVIGVSSFEGLLQDIPEGVRRRAPLDLPPPLAQPDLLRELAGMAGENAAGPGWATFLGAGAYDHTIPIPVRHLIGRGEFYTSYTPYQAEMSQGLLQTIYEYQSMICAITGMDVANASMYEGGSALAEAALMACRVTGRDHLLVSGAIHPHYRAVVRTYLSGIVSKITEIPWKDGATDPEALARAVSKAKDRPPAAVILQHPNFFGCLEETDRAASIARETGGLLVVSADPISLGILRPPGEYGADIVVGEGQSLGNPLSFGGPYFGFFATRTPYLRQMPGRIVGATVDRRGNRGYCLTLQAREQHIRRERATSNICTNEALNALAGTIHLAALGPQGLREMGEACLQNAHYAHDRITALPGFAPAWPRPFFKEFTIRAPVPAERINRKLRRDQIIGGLPLDRHGRNLRRHWLLAVTEKRTRAEIDGMVDAVARATTARGKKSGGSADA